MTTVLVALGSLTCGVLVGAGLVVGAVVCLAVMSGGDRVDR